MLSETERLLQRLMLPGLTEDARASIEAALKASLDDPWLVARTAILPADHPLKQEASIVCTVLQRATAGATGEDVTAALSQIPRRSPFSPYVMALRAIHSAYAGDRVSALRLARGIDPVSPAHRLGRGVQALLGERPPLSRALQRFQGLAGSGDVSALCADLDRAFAGKEEARAVRAIPRLLSALGTSHPRLLLRLLEEISRRWVELDWSPEHLLPVRNALGAAAFLRLEAIGLSPELPGIASRKWQRYLELTVLPPPEQALVLSRAAELLQRDPEFCMGCGVIHEDEEEVESLLEDLLEGIELEDLPWFERQRLEAKARALLDDELGLGSSLPLAKLLEQAAVVSPSDETFRPLLQHLSSRGTPADREAAWERWSSVCPDALEPVLALAELARKKPAPRQALAWIQKAEQIDPLNPEVRLQKLRLLLNGAIVRLQAGRFHLLDQDLRALRGLPATLDPARCAVIAGIEALRQAGSAPELVAVSTKEVEAVLGDPVLASLLVSTLVMHARGGKGRLQSPPLPLPSFICGDEEGRRWARHLLEHQALAETLGVSTWLKTPLSALSAWLPPPSPSQPPPLSVPELLQLGALANSAGLIDLAWSFSDWTLDGPPDSAPAAALLLRFHLCCHVSTWEVGRALPCLQAAFTLARTQHDGRVLRDSTLFLEQMLSHRRESVPPSTLSREALQEVLREERRRCEGRAAARLPSPVGAGPIAEASGQESLPFMPSA